MRDAFQRADLAATLPHPQTNMSAMTMSAALVAGKVSVTSKCVRGTGRVACDARASIRHPRASRFSHPPSSHDADIPASVARRRVARASRPGADRVPSSPPLPNPQVHPQGAVFQVQVRRASSSLVSGERSRSLATAPRRDFRHLHRLSAGYPADVAGRIARRDRRAPRCVRRGVSASRDGPRRPRPRGGTYASSAPGPHATGARTRSANKTTKAFFRKLPTFGGFATRTSEDAFWSE